MAAGLLGGVGGLVGLGAGADAGGGEVLLTAGLARRIADGFLGGGDVGLPLGVDRLQALGLVAGRGEGRLSLLDRDLIVGGVELEQHLSLADRLVLLDLDLDHPAGDAGADAGAGRLDIGVVGGLVAAAGQDHERHDAQDDQRDADHQRPAQPGAQRAAAGTARAFGLGVADGLISFCVAHAPCSTFRAIGRGGLGDRSQVSDIRESIASPCDGAVTTEIGLALS